MKATIRSIQLSDFGPFQGSHTFELNGPGTYALCATNGKGKSHVALGVKMTTSPSCALEKPMGAYVHRYGLGDGTSTSARVEVVYDIDGETLEVARSIGISKSASDAELRELLAKGDMPKASGRWGAKWKGQSIKSTADVIQLLTSLFGLENRIQEDAVFVQQNQAGAIIRDTPSVRSKSLQFLSGAEVCQKAADVAQRKLATMHVVDRSSELEEKQTKLQGLRDMIAEREREEQELNTLLLPAEDVDRIRVRLQASSIAKERSSKYLEARAELERKKGELSALTSQLTMMGVETLERQQELERKAVDNDAAQAFLASATSNSRLAQQRKLLLTEIDQLEQEGKHTQPPDAPKEPKESIAELKEIQASLATEVTNAKNFLKAFATGVCPTCGSKPANVEELVLQNKKALEENQPLLDECRSQLSHLEAQWSNYEHRKTKFATWQEEWTRRVNSAADRLEKMPDMAEVDPEALATNQAVAAEYKAMSAELSSIKDKQAAATATASRLAAQVESLTASCSDLAKESEKIMDPAEYQQQSELLAANEDVKEMLANVRGVLTTHRKNEEDLKADIHNLEDSQAKISKKLQAIEFLEGLKSVMHHSAIPHDRSIVYLESLNKIMGSYCQVLHAPFSLFVDPETQLFMCQTQDAVFPAYQLSGGQQTLAAWAWHLALYERHASQVGFIWMDEPTVGLDDANLANIGEAVRHLTKYCHGSGMQFIMVTHESSIASVFDKVIHI